MEVKLGVCVITRNDPDGLAETLRPLVEAVPSSSVLVSDDSDPLAGSLTAKVCADFSVRWIPGPRLGPVGNRWEGGSELYKLGFTHVLFLDDDITVGSDVINALITYAIAHPRAVCCPLTYEGGQAILPTEMNWKGVRQRKAPIIGGAGLTDQCMLWPRSAFESVEWDPSFFYGYGEAWLGVQLKSQGFAIHVLPQLGVVHRSPGRAGGGSVWFRQESARVYFNFKSKRLLYGISVAMVVAITDVVLTNAKRVLLLRPLYIRPYLQAFRHLLSTASV